MDKISSLNLDLDRVLIQFIIPGLTAVFPWLILYINHHWLDCQFLICNTSLLITLFILISLISGIILENIGSLIEVNYYDKINSKGDSNYISIWHKYLALNYNGKEPVGHRYIRNILLRMKFELSFGCAQIPMAIGIIILDTQHEIFQSCALKSLLFYICPLAIFIYLVFKEGLSSSRVLAETRKILVEKYYT